MHSSAWFLAAVLLAGCIGGAETREPPTDSPEPSSTAGPDFGFVEGTATDEEWVPLANVSVTAFKIDEARASTGADGRYRLGPLPPGANRVVFDRLGYREMARDVEVAAGITSSLDVRLEATPVTKPYVDLHTFRGHFGVHLGVYTVDCDCGWLTSYGANRNKFNVSVGHGFEDVVAGVTWQQNGLSNADVLEATLDPDGEYPWWVTKVGPSPLTVRPNMSDVPRPVSKVFSTVSPYEDIGVDILVDQYFDLYLNVFYYGPSSKEETGIPPK